MIRYRCPACRNVDECPDRNAGRLVACATCGQKLQVPPAPKDVVMPAESLLPRGKRRWSDWVWRPAPRNRRENSGETLIRFGGNLFTVWLFFNLFIWGGLILLVVLARLLTGHSLQ